ncbi:16S rRNA (uracil(1498)-N(3))-methyltransferase [Phormidesmis priestleyi ULC007]|uniref:Ribosomal RNA small subunit methyltransferase E n=1 Tax=Phormidesmis priestleyi ULC007 TaxID=1920490 RepID=A0A2T1D644_9CYAN|nr:16S rRNA (uracil(1498)-N(3))-methyltransferase [Phormidesmis priestleyi]PSB15950.1 16S rRNA (uracil(1498)-N(3))-methyltransferase [Phormidesmis priestleyi ULC007]PZO49839.1 MAG: 16S rRNA (uracil(1498)-N(3))-methyltransferase [Phormidesmis priestleyi]
MAQLQRLVITASQIDRQQIVLTAEQQHYLSRVLRLRSGDQFIAMNGQGQGWLAALESDRAQILEPIHAHSELSISVTLVLALPKGNGFDDVVRQATELGVTCIAPVISDRTLLNPSANKLERWRRIAQEAAEQCERQIVPEILDPVSWNDCLQIESSDSDICRLICLARGNSPHLLNYLNKSVCPSITLAIGTEGGWTDAEIEGAIAAGYQPISLGRRILRAVTAPIVALSLVAGVLERMKNEE